MGTSELRKLIVYAPPDREDEAYAYAARNDIEDELEHKVVITDYCPPGRMFITSGSLFDMLEELGASQES
jgi:hypothetical protein